MSSSSSTTSNPQEFFFSTVKTVFENWTALQLAVAHRFAGSKTKETYDWFLNATFEWIRDNSDLEDFELEEFFENTMNQEFNTILDDNSASQLSKILVNYNRLFRSGKLNEITEDLNKKFPRIKQATSTVSSSIKVKDQMNDDDDDDTATSDEEDEEGDENNNNCEDMNVDEAECGEKRSTKNEMNEEEKNNFQMLEEGWTFVAKSGKHFTK